MGVVYYQLLARSRAARPERNRTETDRKCTGGVQVIERQTAELAFCFDGMERNGNVTIFIPPTVSIWSQSAWLIHFFSFFFYVVDSNKSRATQFNCGDIQL